MCFCVSVVGVSPVFGRTSTSSKTRGVHYLVNWAGYPDTANSWEPASNVSVALQEEFRSGASVPKLDKLRRLAGTLVDNSASPEEMKAGKDCQTEKDKHPETSRFRTAGKKFRMPCVKTAKFLARISGGCLAMQCYWSDCGTLWS